VKGNKYVAMRRIERTLGASILCSLALTAFQVQAETPATDVESTETGIPAEGAEAEVAPVILRPRWVTPRRRDVSEEVDAAQVEDVGAESPTQAEESAIAETSSDAESDDAGSAEVESGDAESAEVESGDAESAEVESGDAESAEVESGDAESAEVESSDAESAEVESSDAESAEVESSDGPSSGEKDWREQARIVIHGRGDAARLSGLVDGLLRDLGADQVEQRKVRTVVEQDHIRFFHEEDADMAAALATELEDVFGVVGLRGLVRYEPSPDPGLLEIWLR